MWCRTRQKYRYFGLFFIFAALILLLLYKTWIHANYHFSEQKLIVPYPIFYRRRHTANCARFFSDGGNLSTQEDFVLQTTNDYGIWKTFSDCKAIFKRLYYPKQPLTIEEEQFPIAFAILVNEDLEQLELFLNSIYTPQNVYCLHIDLKSPYYIHDALKRFATCFTNIHISPEYYPVTNTGVNTIRAYMSCLKLLNILDIQWKYVLTLQGHDFPLRTNSEMVQILKVHDGANDVELLKAPEERIRKNYKLIPDSRGFVANFIAAEGSRPPLDDVTFYKGSVAAALSKEFISFVLKSHNLTSHLMTFLDKSPLGDELFWSTLSHDQRLKAPGSYPGSCASRGLKYWISRFTVWLDYKHLKCYGKARHGVCLFSIKDLILLESRPELFLNKFWMSYDPLAVYCMHERLFNRTYNRIGHQNQLNLDYYRNLSSLKYQKHLKLKNGAEHKEFECVTCPDNYLCLH